MVLHFGYSAKIVNIETAFLYRDLEEEIYVQAAHQYYKKAVEILRSSSFVGGTINPCLYVKKSAKGIV